MSKPVLITAKVCGHATVDLHRLQTKVQVVTNAQCSVSTADSLLFLQDLLRDFAPQAVAADAPDDLEQATCTSTQQADPKLQIEARGAAVHDVDGNDEADSVVDADTVDWIEVQLHHSPAASQLHATLVVLS